MKPDKRWIKVLSLALCLPSTIFVMGYFVHEVIENELMDPFWALMIFFAVIFNILFFMVWHARFKDKS